MRTHSFGDYKFIPDAVFKSIDEAAGAPHRWDFVVVTTKALPDVSDDSRLIERVVGEETSAIVLIQNGVGVEEPYRSRFKRASVLSAVTIVSAEQTEPGVVVQNRWTRVSVGPYTDGRGVDGAKDAVTERFVGMLKAGGIKDAELYDEKDLQAVRWHKIAVRLFLDSAKSYVLTRRVTDQRGYEPVRGVVKRYG